MSENSCFIKTTIDNYEYITAFVSDTIRLYTQEKPAYVLDFGCGNDHLVEMLSSIGSHIHTFGCDTFQVKPEYKQSIKEELFAEGRMLEMENNNIPFPDSMFDIVVSNQVMEHVEDMDLTISEVSRVLKPGGMALSLFPDKGVWREGHCGIPFAHWFNKGSRLKPIYLFLFRCLGLGFCKENKTRMQWSLDFTQYLDEWTHYRSYDEIMSIFNKYLIGPEHLENNYMEKRLKGSIILFMIPETIRTLIIRKLSGMVFTFTKSGHGE